MFFSKKLFLVKDSVVSFKLKKASNASINSRKLKFRLPMQANFDKLRLFKKNFAGRGLYGRVTVYTKGPCLKVKKPVINYFFRDKSVFLTAGISYVGGINTKLATLIFSSSGKVSYLLSKPADNLFFLTRLRVLSFSYSRFYKELLHSKPNIYIPEIPYMLLQQKKNDHISSLEANIYSGVQYARGFGCSCSIIKLDTRTGLGLVKLPSGIKKVFSAFSLASAGPANLKLLKRDLCNTKSGFYRNCGSKPKVRGVAKNPVDHPHGGRTKAIKYPRTPWGKTTKFK